MNTYQHTATAGSVHTNNTVDGGATGRKELSEFDTGLRKNYYTCDDAWSTAHGVDGKELHAYGSS